MQIEQIMEPHMLNLRNKGIKFEKGKIHKGCVKDAYSKLSIGSIPANYESIVYHHDNKKGFGASVPRFEDSKAELGTEDSFNNTEEEKDVPNHPSHSVNGYGSMIDREKKMSFKPSTAPGPGQYLKNTSEKRASKTSLANLRLKSSSKFFEVQKKAQTQQVFNPGPGSYDSYSQKKKNVGWKSSFVTKVNRQGYIKKSITPGPNFYNKKEQDRIEETCQEQREQLEEQLLAKITPQKRIKQKIILPKNEKKQIPGPGSYNCKVPNFKPLYERIKVSNNFIASNKQRFDYIQKQNCVPTACTYTLNSNFSQEKKLINSPCFMSETIRDTFQNVDLKLGPALSKAKKIDQKKNFHFNIRGDWL